MKSLPGPGAYELRLGNQFQLNPKLVNQSFTRTMREIDRPALDRTPGPGAYKLPARFNELLPYQIPSINNKKSFKSLKCIMSCPTENEDVVNKKYSIKNPNPNNPLDDAN